MAIDGVTREAPVGLAVVGASAGGVQALKALVAALPAGLGCPVVVVLHISSMGTSVLPQILTRAGVLPATAAVDGEALVAGHIHVAPPDSHVLITRGVIHLSSGPRENGHRPAVDPTMRSAAEAYDHTAVGIVLSGTRDDGTAGLAAIQAGGGRILVQDPAEALYPGMPTHALDHLSVDAVLSIVGIARWLVAAASGVRGDDAPGGVETSDLPSFRGDGPSDVGTRFTCPDCGGVLFEVAEAGVLRLQCSVGHAYSPASLVAEQGRELERALWTATRALDDRVVLLDRMAARARAAGQPESAATFATQAREARRQAAIIRESMQRVADMGLPPSPVTGAGAR